MQRGLLTKNKIKELATKQNQLPDKIIKTMNNIWVADFETITEQTNYWKEHKQTGITYGHIKNLIDPQFSYSFIKIDQFIDYLTLSKLYDQTIYFHNLSFDGVFILDWAVKNGYKVVNEITNFKQISVFRTTGNKIYSIKMSFKSKHCKLRFLNFQCSLLLLSSSVEKLGKAIKMDKYTKEQKEDLNFHNKEPMNSIDEFESAHYDYCLYCRNDVEIVRICLFDFYVSIYQFMESESYEDDFYKILSKPTISSISNFLQEIMFIKRYGSIDNMYINNHKEWEIMDKFTQGGFTQPNPAYKGSVVDKNWYIVDLKSAYPAIMQGLIPIGNVIYDQPDDYDENANNYACFVEVEYEYIKCIHSVPMLKNWSTKFIGEIKYDRYFLEATNYKTWLLKEEMDAIEKHHIFKGKKILNKYWYKLDNPLTHFVDTFFKLKEEYKKNAPAKSHTYKIILNSGYGVHCKRLDRLSVYVGKEDKLSIFDKNFTRKENIDLNKENRHSYIQNTILSAYENDDLSLWTKFPHKAIANYITAKTRIKLFDGIYYFGADHFSYCDTDSLFLFDLDVSKVDTYCGTKLGDWELESKSGTKFKIDRPKLYRMFDNAGYIIKKGTAGFTLTEKDYETLDQTKKVVVENAALVYVRVDGGLLLVPITKAIDLDISLSVSKVDYNFTDDVEKELDNLLTTKRKEREEIVKKLLNKK